MVQGPLAVLFQMFDMFSMVYFTLYSRHRLDVSLPPLPCLPETRTPDSGKKTNICKTPDVEPNPPPDIDYFPSPSQVI